jgi:hypothetical protein
MLPRVPAYVGAPLCFERTRSRALVETRGATPIVSLDAETAEGAYQLEASDCSSIATTSSAATTRSAAASCGSDISRSPR